MVARFASELQEKLFKAVRSNLEQIGYRGQLLADNYRFSDCFRSDSPERIADVAAFGQIPLSYDSACFAVLISGSKSGAALVSDFRALGAPLALEIGSDEVTQWVVGKDSASTAVRARFGVNDIPRVFESNKMDWASKSILRAKNIAAAVPGQRQLTFYDTGLIPAIEDQIRRRLDPVLRDVLHRARLAYRKSTGNDSDDREIFRLIFRFLAAKVLHDREVPGFESVSANNLNDILEQVRVYYGETQALLTDQETRDVAGSLLWNRMNFRNLSVEVLAYLYEYTLVDEEMRVTHGTHSTPHSIARYIVHQLPMESVPEAERTVVEPCSGHGIFLIAALQRLRDILQAEMTFEQRHKYFVRMLSGFEIDSFAVEVSKLCLVLADFPNKNSWRVQTDDVFSSATFRSDLGSARFVVGNPPFEDFPESERSQDHRSVKKPVELLHTILDHIHKDGSIGFVLPQQVISGSSYKAIRERLTSRFEEINVVSLPDRIFNVSTSESALLLATHPRPDQPKLIRVGFSEVSDDGRDAFLKYYQITRTDKSDKTSAEVADGLEVPVLNEVWMRLAENAKLREFAEIHRGIEWTKFDESCYSSEPQEGYEKGYATAQNSALEAYVAPSHVYLKMRDLKGGAHTLPWQTEKLFVNAVRLSRPGWRCAAFIDREGLYGTQNFHGIWLKQPAKASLEVLAAILNGPLAATYISSHEGRKKHNQIKTLKKLPMPDLSDNDKAEITQLVYHYMTLSEPAAVQEDEPLLRTLILRIDALILKAYALPPRLERNVLDYFNGRQRPVPFAFTRFFPKEFSATVPLWMYISESFQRSTAKQFLKSIPKVSKTELRDSQERAE